MYSTLLKKFGDPIKTEVAYEFGGGGAQFNQIQELWFKTRHATLIVKPEGPRGDLVGNMLARIMQRWLADVV